MTPIPRTPSMLRWTGALAVAALLVGPGCSPSPGTPGGSQIPPSQPAAGGDTEPDPRLPKAYNYKIVNTYPHDTRAYTQGLMWDEGFLIETTGRPKTSWLRRVNLENGRVMREASLPPTEFGEGVCRWEDTYIQLTWQAGQAIVWDRNGFYERKRFDYEGEGWGLTVLNDELVMSNGTSELQVRDPETFALKRRLQVKIFDGRSRSYVPIRALNELETVDGEVWANLYQDETIVRIDMETGYITSFIDLRGITAMQNVPDPSNEVLNGIAHDPETGRLFITGKYWPNLYQIELVERP